MQDARTERRNRNAQAEREAQEEDARISAVGLRVIYFLVMFGIVAMYPLTKSHLQTLAFVFIFVITGVMLFFSIVKLEVASVSQNTLQRHRDRIFYIASIHWIIYGTLYFFTKVNIYTEWLAFLLQTPLAAIHLGIMLFKWHIDKAMNDNITNPYTMHIVVAVLYLYNILVMLPISDNNILTGNYFETFVRYIVFLVFYILYIAVYNPYVCRTPGVIVETYIVTTTPLFMNFYVTLVFAGSSSAYLLCRILYTNHRAIWNSLRTDFNAAIAMDDDADPNAQQIILQQLVEEEEEGRSPGQELSRELFEGERGVDLFDES
jgi:hypothetical protein